MSKNRVCERCKYFKSRQGAGDVGDCRFNPPVLLHRGCSEFPEAEETSWCGKFEVNLDKYHTDGRKIYTRVDTNTVPLPGSMYND